MDAALDAANVARVAHYIRGRTRELAEGEQEGEQGAGKGGKGRRRGRRAGAEGEEDGDGMEEEEDEEQKEEEGPQGFQSIVISLKVGEWENAKGMYCGGN